VVALNVNVSDAKANGRLRLMISSNDQRSAAAQTYPALWQTAVLGRRTEVGSAEGVYHRVQAGVLSDAGALPAVRGNL
jgi:hypothetical protein